MARKKRSALAGTAAGLTVAIAAAAPAIAAPPVKLAPPVKMAATVSIDGRSVTFKADAAAARLTINAGRTMLHLTARSDAIGAIFIADLAISSPATPAGTYPLGSSGSTAALEIPRRSPDPAERRFTLTEGVIRINSYSAEAKTIAGTFAAAGATGSGTTRAEITYGSFFDVPID